MSQRRFYKAALITSISLAGSSLVAPAFASAQSLPQADIFDMALDNGTITNSASETEPLTIGAPSVAQDSVLERPVAQFDGRKDAVGFDIGDKFDQVKDGFTVECVFRYDGDFDGNEKSLCANKEAGGWAMVIYGDQLTFTVNANGGYKKAQQKMEPGQWYHAVGVFDGHKNELYVNGEKVAENTGATGDIKKPKSNSSAVMIGADSGPNNSAQFYSDVAVSEARVFSDPLSAQDVTALYEDSNLSTDKKAEITNSSPSAGDHLTSPVTFDVEVNDEALISRELTYTLDGEEIERGQEIGTGLKEGNHVIEVEGHDVFGNQISQSIDFTSGNLPGAAGTDSTPSGNGATISARAENPSGGDVETTFTEADVSVAEKGFQGTFNEIPEELDFEYQDGEDFEKSLNPSNEEAQKSASTEDMPFQRFDLKLKDAEKDVHDLAWSGAVDPKRAVRLMAWNTKTSTWEKLAESRGVSEDQVSLSAQVNSDFVDDDTIHTMVVGYDVFADDLNEPVNEEFADANDYDFAIAHHTDTQYLSEGAVEKATAEERKKWEEGYTAATKWIADNADERKIAYSAHTGDLIENWRVAGEDRANAKKEFEVASRAQKNLEDAGVVNGVLPGNHDNISGEEVGAGNLYNEYFGPDRYEAQQGKGNWAKEDASYHPYAEGNNDNHYDLFTTNGMDFIALHLGYDVTEEEAAWADKVLKQYPDRNAIVLTHAYLKPSNSPDGRNSDFSHDGVMVYDNVIKKNPNVALVLAGHEHGVSIVTRKDVGHTNNHVTELLADYQFYEVGSDELGLTETGKYDGDTGLRFGSSYLRLLQFDLKNNEMVVDTYSPLLDDHNATEYDDRQRYNGHEDEFRVPIQFQTRKTNFETNSMVALTDTGKEIGKDTAKSGWPTSTIYKDLKAGQTYGWYATTADASSKDTTKRGIVRQFGVFTAQENTADNAVPELVVPSEKLTISQGAEADLAKGVSANDKEDGDLTEKVEVIGSVDTSKPGTYSVTYAVTDSAGNQALASRVVEVTATGGSHNAGGSSISDSSSSNSSSSQSSSHRVLPTIFGALIGAAGATGIIAGLLNYFAPETIQKLKRAFGL